MKKPRFRVGQVVRNRHDGRFRKIGRVESYAKGFLYYFVDGWQAEAASDYRPLTPREAGRPRKQ